MERNSATESEKDCKFDDIDVKFESPICSTYSQYTEDKSETKASSTEESETLLRFWENLEHYIAMATNALSPVKNKSDGDDSDIEMRECLYCDVCFEEFLDESDLKSHIQAWHSNTGQRPEDMHVKVEKDAAEEKNNNDETKEYLLQLASTKSVVLNPDYLEASLMFNCPIKTRSLSKLTYSTNPSDGCNSTNRINSAQTKLRTPQSTRKDPIETIPSNVIWKPRVVRAKTINIPSSAPPPSTERNKNGSLTNNFQNLQVITGEKMYSTKKSNCFTKPDGNLVQTSNNEKAANQLQKKPRTLRRNTVKPINKSVVSVYQFEFYKTCCLVCSKQFRYYKELKKHMMDVHPNANPYICNVCEKGFNTKESLYLHQRYEQRHKKTSRTCEKCNEYFNTQTMYVRHAITCK